MGDGARTVTAVEHETWARAIGRLDRTRLLKDLQAQARVLEDDLRARTESEPEFRDALRGEYEKAVAAERTAAMYETWRDERVVQIAAAWVLAIIIAVSGSPLDDVKRLENVSFVMRRGVVHKLDGKRQPFPEERT